MSLIDATTQGHRFGQDVKGTGYSTNHSHHTNAMQVLQARAWGVGITDPVSLMCQVAFQRPGKPGVTLLGVRFHTSHMHSTLTVPLTRTWRSMSL